MTDKTMVIVSGVNGGIGKAYYQYYQNKPGCECYAIKRKGDFDNKTIKLDLFDQKASFEAVQNLNLSDITNILYIHGVGIDKFEPNGIPHIDKNNDGIDDEVFDSNVMTFLNFGGELIKKAHEKSKPITIVNIGSISDIFTVPLWQSFNKSKNFVRQYMKQQCSPLVKSVFCNISSTYAGDKFARKNANTDYWLKPDELIERSTPLIDDVVSGKIRTNYIEADFFNRCPHYRSDYFTNISELSKRWRKDMGYAENEQVPHGLRI